MILHVKLNSYNAFIFQKSLKPFTFNAPMSTSAKIPLQSRTFARSKGCWNCVVGDALVFTGDGVARLDDGQPSAVHNKHGLQPTDGWRESAIARDVVEVITTYGARVKTTPDHRFFTERGWIAAQALRPGEEIAGINDLVIGARRVDADDAFLVGALTGDGWSNPDRGIGFGFRADGHDWSRLVRIAQACFESRGVPSLKNEGRFKQIEWRTNAAKQWAEAFSKARVPANIWGADVQAIGAYLRGLFSTDGTASVNPRAVVRFYQANEQLAREVHLLLRMIGIASQLSVDLRAPAYRDLWCITIARRRSLDRFFEVVGFEDQARQNLVYAASQVIKDRGLPERVHRVVPAGKEKVYDISVPKGRSFYANGLLVHNCKHAGDPATVGVPHWLNVCRPRDEAAILKPLKDQLAAIPAHDKRAKTKARRSELLRVIDKHAQIIQAHEDAITKGEVVRCTNRLCKDPGDFKSHRFLCDQWSGTTGAALAQGGAKTSDMLPGELYDRFGDGN